MSKILVTGGCGYIGSQTIIQLIKETDYEIVSVDNFMNSSAKTLDRIFKITGKRVVNHEVDLTNLELCRKIFEEHDDLIGVIHFAALKSVPESVENPLLYYHNNLNSLINILTCCEEFEVVNHIFSSSCSVYGNVEALPVSEKTVLSKAESPYAHTKQIGEDIIRNFSRNSKVSTVALRYFNPVGADLSGLIGEDPINRPTNLVPVITQTAAGIIPSLTVYGGDYDTRDGTCIRDYIHVIDLANAHIKALEYLLNSKNIEKFEIYNLGAGQGVSVREAITAFEKVSTKKLNYSIGPKRAGDVKSIYSDCHQAKERLGWEVEIGIETMMETAWKWQLTLCEEMGIEI